MFSTKTFAGNKFANLNTFSKRKTASFRKQHFSTQSYPSKAVTVQYSSHGSPDAVLKVANETLPSTLGDNQIVVKMIAAPINPADINMIEGTYSIRPKLPAVGGNEGVGRIVAVGPKVKDLSIDDFVIPTRPGLGTWRTYGVFSQSDFLRVPSDIQPEYSATISVNPSTALRLLDDFVDLKQGDVVIQNGANSMVGVAVVQLAKERKIKTINVVRHTRPDFADVVERIKALGGYAVVGDDYLTTPEFKRLISDLPKPKLALNCVGGTSATEIARNLDNGGVMVTYGGMSRKPITIPTSLLLFKNISLKGFWLSKWIEEHSVDERLKMYDSLFNLIRRGRLMLWMEKWKFNQFTSALNRVNEPFRNRKVVLTMEDIQEPPEKEI